MECPLCKVEMGISQSVYKVSTDDEGNKKMYIEQDLKCRSKQCANYGKVVTTVRNPIGNVEFE